MNDIKFNKTHDDFGKKVLQVIKQVLPYVKHRLYVGETKGIVPRNMYSPSGIVDDAVIDLYKEHEHTIKDENKIKFYLFAISDKKLQRIFKKEKFHKSTLSTRDILNNELKQLEEKYTVDANFDLIMEEELDDISYHQKDFKKTTILYDEAQEQIIKTLDLTKQNILLTEKQRLALNNIYHWLPDEISGILDLFVFGRLTYSEIAIVKQTDEFNIKKSIQEVSNLIRKNIL